MVMQLVETSEGPRIHVPLNIKKRSGRKQIVVLDTPETRAPEPKSEPGAAHHDAMVVAFARAFRWKKMLDDGTYCSIAEMGESLGINRFYLARLLRLTLLAPDIVEAIVDGCEPDGLSLEQLRRPMPVSWEEQKTRLFCNMIKASSQHYVPAGSGEPAGCSLYQELNRQSLR